MAGTYVKESLATSTKDMARFRLGDVGRLYDESGSQIWLLDDVEIAGLISVFGVMEGTAQCADALATRFAQEPTKYKDESGTEVEWSARISRWEKLAISLRSGDTQTSGYAIGGPAVGQSTGPDMKGVR
jgi:hypothetical protein